MAGSEFFASKKSAAVFKHGILSRYPVVFASKTGANSDGNRVVFLDGYAGRGEYDDGQPGSPLLLSRCAEFVSGFRNVEGYFVEQDPENFANLQRVLDAKGGPTARHVRHGSLDEHLPEALRIAHGVPLFAFLDPFGPALDFARVKADLLGRPSRPPTEVLLHFSVLSVARMAGAVHKARQRNTALPVGDRKTAERLNRFLGGDWWQEHFADIRGEDDEQRATDIAMRVCDTYEKRLTAGTRYQAIKMPVRPRPDLLPKYVLVLFTASSEGAWHFADAVGKAGVEWSVAWQVAEAQRVDAKHEAVGQFSLFSALDNDIAPSVTPTVERYSATNKETWIASIAKNLDGMLTDVGPFRPTDKVPEVYGTTLGQASTPHVRAAVKRLSSNGKVSHDGKGDFWKDLLRRNP